ncbi:MAG: Uncharacterized protein JWO38_408 [Gemmataceae bacterium]|nr:Uncharacterized protein [Gemmataceae bacterium]
MPFSPQRTLTSNKIKPARHPEKARTQAVRLAGGVNYVAGQVLEEVNAAAANAVQTLTVSGSPTGGTFVLGFPSVNGGFDVTTAIAFNATGAAVQTVLQALLGTNNVTVTGPSAGVYTLTYANELATRPIPLPTLVSNALTGGSSPTVTPATITPGSPGPVGYFQAYPTAGVARCVLECNTRTAVNGSVIDEFGATQNLTASAYISGEFFVSDLTGLDVTAVPANGTPGTFGKLKSGASLATAGAIVELE